ncbi:hypothetical protein LCGC14_0368470 [marine sediment metagenome]|uniref:Uncharacterized protein n=1 Tax=marine sediment metagenome TaxID=412755 RepID=A0A0F9T5Y0_9ZZZZ
MDYTTIKNRTFERYYFNAYLPGTLGAYESSVIFNYLLAIESLQENLTREMNISEVWIDNNNPTWYTSTLSDLFFVPRYSGETDVEYLERLTLLTGVNQDETTIINSVYSVINMAVPNNSYIQITDKLEDTDIAAWGDVTNTTKWDSVKLWSSIYNVQRTLFLVDISFTTRGSNSDITTWDYWNESENYTKIEDIVKLYKPPGSTFELRLNSPEDVETTIEVFSNTLIVSP